MKLPVHIRPSDSGHSVQAYCPDLPGCAAAAPTVDEALALLRTRVDAYFAESARRAPRGTRIVTLEV